MDTSALISLTQQALILVAIVAAPSVICAALIGLVIGILQAVTQIQDQSIGQAMKIMFVIGIVVVTQAWISSQIFQFAQHQFKSIPTLVKSKGPPPT
jgi:type III secretion protein S